MAKKHLPIQFFEKRKDYDDRSTEGGGNSAPPSWVLTGDALTAKSSALTSSVGDVITVFRERQSQEKKLPLVVCTTLEEKAIAKSHRSEITGLYIDENGSNVVFYGGNAGMNAGKLEKTGIKSFSIDGTPAYNVGTSFSTPWVSRMAAELTHLVKEEFDPLLIRALLIHNAKYPANNSMSMTDKVTQMGFGAPSSVQEMLYNSEDEITLILRDTLEKGSFIEMFDFPFPESLVDKDGNFVGQIIVTLVTKSLLDDKQAGEYCQSNIDILFGTYETETDRDTSKKGIKNPKGLEEPQNILLESLYSARVKGAHPFTGFERECTLVKYGKKFHPVKKYAIDLSEMTTSNRQRYLRGDRKWYLKIEGLYRDFIEQDARARNYQLSQEYCLLLTIRDPNGKAPVYDEVAQQLDYKNFLHHNIQLRNVVTIDGTL